MSEQPKEKSAEDLLAMLDTLSSKIGEIAMPEFSMLADKLSTLDKQKCGVIEKINEARNTLREKINEDSADG